MAELKSRAAAHLLESRLFMDESALILRSQDLLLDSAYMMCLLARPLLILTVPMALLMQLDALFGHAPLRTGEPAVVTVDSRQDSITVPDGVAAETEPVYMPATNDTCWRTGPSRPASGTMRAGTRETTLAGGPGVAYLSHQNGIAYPKATIFCIHWLVWFLALSTVAAFLFRKRMRVVL
jgi:hypothetical protein